MSLLEELDEEASTAYVGRCPVRKWMLTLDPETAAEVEAVLRSDHQAPRIHSLLKRKFGITFAEAAVQNHRRTLRAAKGGCQCPV